MASATRRCASARRVAPMRSRSVLRTIACAKEKRPALDLADQSDPCDVLERAEDLLFGPPDERSKEVELEAEPDHGGRP